MRRLLRALAALVALGLAAPVFAKPPVWVAHGPRATVVLFGSVHLLPKDLDWRPAELDAAMAKADEIWFEIPIDAATQDAASATSLKNGLLAENDRLLAHLSPEQARRLAHVAQKLGVLPQALEHMRPWLAEVTLSLAEDMNAGGRVEIGVEQQLAALAPPKARRHAFETVAQQVAFLSEAPMADQVASLDATLLEIEGKPNLFENVIADWMTGDMAAIEAEALTPVREASPVIFDRLITARNTRWTQILTRRLKGHGLVVVVVGMGHMAGPGGVPALLRAQGITVDGP